MINIVCDTWQNELPKILSDSVDLIIIDPPYLVTGKKWDKTEQVTQELSIELFRIGKQHSSLYVWCGIGEKSNSLLKWLPIFSKNWIFKDLITWKKQRGMGNKRGWLYTREEIMWFVKDNKSYMWNKEYQYSNIKREKSKYEYKLKNGKLSDDYIKSEYLRYSNVWTDISEVSFNTSNRDNNYHYTPKPEKAIERIILAHTKVGDTVLDCFMGSGTTAIVCKKLGLSCIGIEQDAEYVRLAQERLNKILL